MARIFKTTLFPHVFGQSRLTLRQIFIVALVAVFLYQGQACTIEQVKKEKSTQSKADALEKSASANGDKSMPNASDRITRKEAQAVDPTGQEPMDESITCLARSIYWEARGEDVSDMQAVANVVMNRLAHEGFPNTICGVVKQGQERGACQFSWWCDGHSDEVIENVLDQASYQLAKEIARKALNKQLPDLTDGAIYFHHKGVNPNWAKTYIMTLKVGGTFFYKPVGDKAK
ncbi:MAG: cell wall hydrolase [Proteobacteria bacterium]|nr:cell wall hydrolase [Pseudomonadota bacterium]